MKLTKSLLNRREFLLIITLYTFLFALFIPEETSVLKMYYQLIMSQTNLLTDFIEIAGFRATFVNVGLHSLVIYLLLLWKGQRYLTSFELGVTGLFLGHAFFGTHIINILPIILGTMFYYYSMHHEKEYRLVSILATANAPLVSSIYLDSVFGPYRWFLAMAVGFVIGSISVKIANQFVQFHKGYTLYNFGYTMGIIAMFISFLFPYFDMNVEINLFQDNEYAINYFEFYFWGWLILLAIIGLYGQKVQLKELWSFIKIKGNFYHNQFRYFSTSTLTLNMIINGIVFYMLLKLINVSLNGPIIGAMLTVILFGAVGKTIFNSLPICLGIIFSVYVSGSSFNSTFIVLALLFSTGLAPISARFGPLWGFVAGVLHFHMVEISGQLHLGMNIYNNGFASGFVAAIVIPIIELIGEWKDSLLNPS